MIAGIENLGGRLFRASLGFENDQVREYLRGFLFAIMECADLSALSKAATSRRSPKATRGLMLCGLETHLKLAPDGSAEAVKEFAHVLAA